MHQLRDLLSAIGSSATILGFVIQTIASLKSSVLQPRDAYSHRAHVYHDRHALRLRLLHQRLRRHLGHRDEQFGVSVGANLVRGKIESRE